MNELINSRKELLELVPEVYKQDQPTMKILRKLFSIARNNRWKVYNEGSRLRIEVDNDRVSATTYIMLPADNVRYPKAARLTFSQVTFKKTGFVLSLPQGRYESVMTADGKIHYTRFKSILSVLSSGLDNVVSAGTEGSMLSNIAYSNKECFRTLEWNEFFSYCGRLCIKDCGPFKKGMIVDVYYLHIKYHTRKPIDLFEGVYAGMHRIGGSLACDLNQITLEQLEAINVKKYSCAKQKFGCQHLCTHSCASDSANSVDASNKKILIKLWKECFGTEKVKP